MSETVRFSKIIPAIIHARFAAYAKAQGLNERDALIYMINQQTPASIVGTITPPPPKPKPANPLTPAEAAYLARLEKADFKDLTNDEIDDLNTLSIKKRGGF